ncbi:STAS domain-containing protein [Streptomyces sp. NPDC005907]|uniref:STAS domain-containing protein n=1 Tax=Streptomyces sp. NPDC005907 TaxID=3154571 RepID=UPI0033C0CBEB
MTPPAGSKSTYLRLTTSPDTDEGVLRLEVHGFLDHAGSDSFLATITGHLADRPGLRALRLNCGALQGLDSMGLAALLMLHRRTTAAQVALHLDDRGPALERMLDITGALDHLVPGHEGEPAGDYARSHRMAYRHTPQDGMSADRTSQGRGPAGPDTSS